MSIGTIIYQTWIDGGPSEILRDELLREDDSFLLPEVGDTVVVSEVSYEVTKRIFDRDVQTAYIKLSRL